MGGILSAFTSLIKLPEKVEGDIKDLVDDTEDDIFTIVHDAETNTYKFLSKTEADIAGLLGQTERDIYKAVHGGELVIRNAEKDAITALDSAADGFIELGSEAQSNLFSTVQFSTFLGGTFVLITTVAFGPKIIATVEKVATGFTD